MNIMMRTTFFTIIFLITTSIVSAKTIEETSTVLSCSMANKFTPKGEWLYQGLVIRLKSDNFLIAAAADAAIDVLNEELNKELVNYNLIVGKTKFSFDKKGRFVIETNGEKIGGLYSNTDTIMKLNLSSIKDVEVTITPQEEGFNLTLKNQQLTDFIRKISVFQQYDIVDYIEPVITTFDSVELGVMLK